jgi:GT2 family glycosyltransferase
MNAGARATTSEVLLFLHADTRLPDGAQAEIARVLAEPGVVAGAFRTWTVADDPKAPRRWLAPLLHLADVRSRVTTLPYGDQALFVRRDAFRAAGGFAEIPLMEDLDLSLRLRKQGRIGRARTSVTVSGRRFLESPVRYTLLVNTFPLLFRMGVAPEKLAALYRDVR